MSQKFEEFVYERPVMESFSADFKRLLHDFEHAESYEKQSELIAAIDEKKSEFTSMYNICHIRHTVNTKDSFYEAEQGFYDQNMPNYEALNTEYYKLLIASNFRKELEEKWGSQLFTIAELSIKTFIPEILEDLKEENQLSSEYTKLKATASIEYDGEQYNLATITPLEIDIDRAKREGAASAKWAFYAGKSAEIETIFDKLVKVRHRIAKKMGYSNFVELGYARMLRSDYDAKMVANFRKQILEHIVPMATKLYERQAKRLGLKSLKYYDEGFRFASGNPKPKGTPDWIVDNAQSMYGELSAETKEFFDFMIDGGLMDLVNKEGKATGGYCTFIGKYKSPFIFSNFNGTSGDIDVLTHEAGHAFQVYSSRDIGIGEYNWPTYEACEIHSMSMEFFTWPWMQLFFKDDTNKYKFAHLSGAIRFLPRIQKPAHKNETKHGR